MKLLVFSDIHGSVPVAEFIVALAGRHKPDALIMLGDILYHGSRNSFPSGYAPSAVVETLTPLAPLVIAVKGNCDSEVDETVLPFPLAGGFSWILDGSTRICAVHGHTFGPQNLPPLREGDMLLFGHTHVPMASTLPSGIHLCNPGSLALPKQGHPPSYGLMENGTFSIHTPGRNEAYMQLVFR